MDIRLYELKEILIQNDNYFTITNHEDKITIECFVKTYSDHETHHINIIVGNCCNEVLNTKYFKTFKNAFFRLIEKHDMNYNEVLLDPIVKGNISMGVIEIELGKVITISNGDNHSDRMLPGGKQIDNQTSEQTLVRQIKNTTGLLVSQYEKIHTIFYMGYYIDVYYIYNIKDIFNKNDLDNHFFKFNGGVVIIQNFKDLLKENISNNELNKVIYKEYKRMKRRIYGKGDW